MGLARPSYIDRLGQRLSMTDFKDEPEPLTMMKVNMAIWRILAENDRLAISFNASGVARCLLKEVDALRKENEDLREQLDSMPYYDPFTEG
jgi:hypothetical protein